MPATDAAQSDRLFLKDARYIDAETLAIRDGHIAVSRGVDGGIGFVDEVPAGGEVIDCAGKLVTHGFAVGHHHIYSALARGMPPAREAPTTFVEILERIEREVQRQCGTGGIADDVDRAIGHGSRQVLHRQRDRRSHVPPGCALQLCWRRPVTGQSQSQHLVTLSMQCVAD